MKEGRRLGGVHAGPESKVLDREKKKKSKQHISGSGRTELGGGEEHAGRPNEPGGRVRGDEGKVALIFSSCLSLFPHFSFFLSVFISQQPRVMVKESV